MAELAGNQGNERDQASGLRRLFIRPPTLVIAIASALAGSSPGQGSAGGTGGIRVNDQNRLVMSFAHDFAAAGQQVTVLDEHPAPSGVAHAYGLQGRKDFLHMLRGDYALDDVAHPVERGVSIIPAARAAGLEELDVADQAALSGNLKLLKRSNDCVIVNCVHRTKRVLSPIAHCADRLVILISPMGEDMKRSYALIKRIAMENLHVPISVVVVGAADGAQALRAAGTLRDVAREHLGMSLQYLGAAFVPGVCRASLLASENRLAPAGVVDSSAYHNALHDMSFRDSVL